MNIVCISDTHCKHNELDTYLMSYVYTKDIDIIIHAGDAANSKDPYRNEHELHDFLEWYSEIDIDNKIFIPGNHDTSFEKGLIKAEDYPAIDFLVNKTITINDVNIYGSPYTPTFGENWAYNIGRHKIKDLWDLIPEDTDILVTHGPPKGILDLCYRSASIYETVGCKSLLNKVFNLPKLSYHIFGHIHDDSHTINSGYRIYNNIGFVNASIVNNNYVSLNDPIKIFI